MGDFGGGLHGFFLLWRGGCGGGWGVVW
jgi:hypothetical protein